MGIHVIGDQHAYLCTCGQAYRAWRSGSGISPRNRERLPVHAASSGLRANTASGHKRECHTSNFTLPLRSYFRKLAVGSWCNSVPGATCGHAEPCKPLGAQASLSDARPLPTGYQKAARMRWACAGLRWAKWPCQRQPPPSFTVVEAPSRAQSYSYLGRKIWALKKLLGGILVTR